MVQSQPLLQQSSSLITKFAELIGHRFDRQRAERILYESHLNESNKATQDWMDTVQSCAEAMEFRIRRHHAPLSEIIDLASSGLPIAFLARSHLSQPDDRSSRSQERQWFLITGKRSGRLSVLDLESSKTNWLTARELQQLTGLQGENHGVWLVSYPVLMHAASANHVGHAGADEDDHHHASELSPFKRLFGILKAEWSDIAVIVIFSLVIGLLTLTTPIAVEALVNTLAFGQFTQPVLVLSLIVLILLSFSATLTAVSTYTSETIQRRLFVRLVEDLSYRLPRVAKPSVESIPLAELTNRFLDIVTIQKSVSKLLLDGIVIIMQTAIGMGVLAFYHPFLLGFDILLLMLIAFTLFVVGRGAIRTAIDESVEKYQMLGWLEEVARNPSSFKFNEGWEFAVNRADHLVFGYLGAREKHFKIVFRQEIFSLGIYCIATTVLLGLGGWLVIAGELSLGQLVAAELIVILIVRSFAKLAEYMESYYDLMAATDKVGLLLDLPMNPHDKLLKLDPAQAVSLRFDHVSLDVAGKGLAVDLDLNLKGGQSLAVLADSDHDLRPLAELCLGERSPDAGKVLINEIDLQEYRLDSLRSALGYAGAVEVFHGTLEENVHLHRTGISHLDVRRAVEVVGLTTAVSQLPKGLHSKLQSGGFPLSPLQASRLMLARAIVSNPRLLIVDGTLDAFGESDFAALVKTLGQDGRAVIIFTHVPEIARLVETSVSLGKAENRGSSRGLH